MCPPPTSAQAVPGSAVIPDHILPQQQRTGQHHGHTKLRLLKNKQTNEKKKEVRDSIARQTVPDCRGRTTEGEELWREKGWGGGGRKVERKRRGKKNKKNIYGINSAIIMKTVNCR